jgi:hypothetical protein
LEEVTILKGLLLEDDIRQGGVSGSRGVDGDYRIGRRRPDWAAVAGSGGERIGQQADWAATSLWSPRRRRGDIVLGLGFGGVELRKE